MIGVRYQPDSSSLPVLLVVDSAEAQDDLIRLLTMNQGCPAMPVTFIPQDDPDTLAKIRRDMVEGIVREYARGEYDDDQTLTYLARIAPGLTDTVHAHLRHAVEAHQEWAGLQNKSLSDFEPELRDWDLLDQRYWALFDEALDDLMKHLDAVWPATTQPAETRGAA